MKNQGLEFIEIDNGQMLMPVKNTREYALFRVIDPKTILTDHYFIAPAQEVTDEFHRKVIVLSDDWKDSGKYIDGKERALDEFNSLTDIFYKKIK
jgi:hypothetical protein